MLAYVQLFIQIGGDIKYFVLMLLVFWTMNGFCLMLMYPKALIAHSSGQSVSSSGNGTSNWQLGSTDSAEQFESWTGAFFASMNMVRISMNASFVYTASD